MKETIESLRQKGYKVYVTHLRHFNLFHIYTEEDIAHSGELVPVRFTNKNDIPLHLREHMLPNGGQTVVTIVKGDINVTGESVCNDNDPFVKRHGFNRAFGKALRELNKKLKENPDKVEWCPKTKTYFSIEYT